MRLRVRQREITAWRERGFASLALLVVVVGVLFAGLTVASLAAQSAKAAVNDRAAAQARCAADTGFERVKLYLRSDPLWSDGSVAVGPVDATSVVENVVVEHYTASDGTPMAVITSTGRCGNARVTVRVVVKLGQTPLIAYYGGGVKQLGAGIPLGLSGSALVKSDVLVNGSFSVGGSAAVGLPGERRAVYACGDITVQKPGSIHGNAYATGSIDPGASTGAVMPYWKPPEPFPGTTDVAAAVGLARQTARSLEAAMGVQHYFPGSKAFTAGDLTRMEGVYFVEGDATVQGGTTAARATIAAAGNIYVSGALTAENLSLIAGRDIRLKNASGTSVALAVAGGDAGWGGTGGGNAYWSLKYGALAARTINGGSLRGNIVLEHNVSIDFNVLAAPVHTAAVVARGDG
ncbi:MAG: hypothetical protein ACPLSY_04875 [Moorellaceae bacterium]